MVVIGTEAMTRQRTWPSEKVLIRPHTGTLSPHLGRGKDPHTGILGPQPTPACCAG